MAFTIDVKAALVFVVTIPLLSVVVFGIMLVSIPLYKKVQAALDKVLGITRENLTGSRVIRAFNKEQDEIAQFHEDNEALTKIQLYVGKISALMNPLTYIIINGAIVVLVWVGAIRVDNGNITQGQVVALVSYMSQILVELIKLANLIININKSIACMNRIETVLDMESSITEHPAAETGSLTSEQAGKEKRQSRRRMPSYFPRLVLLMRAHRRKHSPTLILRSDAERPSVLSEEPVLENLRS